MKLIILFFALLVVIAAVDSKKPVSSKKKVLPKTKSRAKAKIKTTTDNILKRFGIPSTDVDSEEAEQLQRGFPRAEDINIPFDDDDSSEKKAQKKKSSTKKPILVPMVEELVEDNSQDEVEKKLKKKKKKCPFWRKVKKWFVKTFIDRDDFEDIIEDPNFRIDATGFGDQAMDSNENLKDSIEALDLPENDD